MLLLRILDRLEETLIATLMAAATILIFVAVVHRYAFGIPFLFPYMQAIHLSWAQELCIYMFVWMAKFGAPMAYYWHHNGQPPTGTPLVPFPHADPLPSNDRLRVLSPASDWTMNSSYGNDAKIAIRLKSASVLIHPREAAARDIKEGDQVELGNEHGRLELIAETTPDVPPEIAFVHKGRWPKLDPNGANVNILNPGTKSDMGESSSVHGVEAELRPLLPLGKRHLEHQHA